MEYVTINTDSNGNPFALTIAKIMVELPASTTGNRDYMRAYFDGEKPNGATQRIALPTLMMNSANGSLNTYEFFTFGGVYFNHAYSAPTLESSSDSMKSFNIDSLVNNLSSFEIRQYSSSATLVPSGTHIIIYGVRS